MDSPLAIALSTQGRLGESLPGQQKLAEAEPLLRAGYEWMKQRREKVPDLAKARVTALRLLYEAQGNREEAARWRAELETGGRPAGP